MTSYFSFFGDNAGLLLQITLGHIVLSVVAVVVAIVLALPLGAWIGHLHRFSFAVVTVTNVFRSLPTLALVAIAIAFVGFGFTNILVALVVLAFPLVLTNTFTAVEGVDPGTVEAARGMGMTGPQILFRVELPSSVPLIMTGVRTSWVYVVATAYLAVFAGRTDTLGDVINDQAGYGYAGVMAAATISVVLAFAGDFLLGLVERAVTPTGLRLIQAQAQGLPTADPTADPAPDPAPSPA